MNNVVKNSKTSPKKSVTAKQLAKSNLTKRKNPDWDNLDRGYRYLTLDMKLPHDLAIAVMGNVVEESLGNYKSVLKNGGGRGLIQWDGRKAPNGRYSLWGSIWASIAKPANVYDSTTDTVKNYWAPWGGLKGDEVRLKFIKAPLKEKAKIYAESYLRPGKPRIADRQLSTMQLDSIYNPRIKDVIVLKDGGMLEFLKNGSGIHIKKKNRGKFTSYCGGKVTDECIRKAKASGNPTLVKRATFAANARKWKHKDGGVFKAADGTKTNIWLKIGNGLNSGWGQLAINIGSSYLLNKALNKQIDYNLEMSDASLDMEKNELKKLIPYYALLVAQQILGPINPENPNEKGGVFAEIVPARLRTLLSGLLELEYNNKKSLNKAQALLLKNQNNSNFILGIGLNLGSMLLNIDFSKKSNNLTASIEQPVANNFLAGYNQFTLKPDYSNMLLQ